MSRILVFKISSSGVRAGGQSHITEFKIALVCPVDEKVVSLRMHLAEVYTFLCLLNFACPQQIPHQIGAIRFLIVPHITLCLITPIDL